MNTRESRAIAALSVIATVGTSCASSIAAGTNGGSSHDGSSQTAGYALVKLAMFADADCTEPLLQNGEPFIVAMDTSATCFAFSYVDPDGLVVPTPHAAFTCSEQGITYDKYPFSADCSASTTKNVPPAKSYFVGTTCEFAPSHKGGVYEKLVDYSYSGSADCSLPSQ